jgi:hypothetical protein
MELIKKLNWKKTITQMKAKQIALWYEQARVGCSCGENGVQPSRKDRQR